MDLVIEPVLWALIYPVRPHDPIGYVRRDRVGFSAHLEAEHLGLFSSWDVAAEAVWDRFVQKAYVDHNRASRVHGSSERH